MNCRNSRNGCSAGDRLEHREPHAAAVGQPAVEHDFGQRFEAIDQRRVGLGCGRFCRAAASPPGRPAETARQRVIARAGGLENQVELGDGAGALRMADLHDLGGFQQLAGLGQQSQLGQEAQQAANHVLQVARGRDAAGVAAAAQRHVEQRLALQRGQQARQAAAHAARVAPNHLRDQLVGKPLPRRPVRRRRGTGHRGADHAGGVGRFHAGLDDLFQQRVLDAPAAVELDQRFLRAARRWDAVAVDRGHQLEQLPVVPPRLVEPDGQRFVAARVGLGHRSHGGQLP